MKLDEVVVGATYGEDNQLEIIDVFNETQLDGTKYRKKRRCRVICHTCKLDEEMWNDGIFNVSIYDIPRGRVPCGCSRSPSYSEAQWNIRIRRKAAQMNCTYLGIAEEWKGGTTHLKLKCNVDQTTWKSCTAHNLLVGNGCPTCATKSRASSQEMSIEECLEVFKSRSNLPDGTKFWKKAGKTWEYWCPVCSVDKYVQAGLCSGIFEIQRTNLTSGILSCRCSKIPRKTKEQREFQIKEEVTRRGCNYVFKGWVDNEFLSRSDIILECAIHGEFYPSVNRFLKGSGCPSCAGYGYQKSKDGSVYVIRVTGSRNFTGYGISSDVERRLSEHRRCLSKIGAVIEDVKTFECSGEAALNLETALKAKFEHFPQDVDGFKREATYLELYQDVIDFIEVWFDDL